MIGLLKAEIRRLLARRMTLLFPGVVALLIIAGVAIAFFVIQSDETSSGVDFVSDIAGGSDAESLFELIAFLLPLMAFVIGASSIGADIKTGMLEQLLTWEPRRLRFAAARCVAAFFGGTLAAIFVAVVYVLTTLGLAAATGTTEGVGELVGTIAVSTLRIGVAGGLFCIFGVGVGLLVNNSVGAIVGFAIYFFIIEGLIGAFLPRVAVRLPVVNTSAFAAGRDVERADGNVFTGDFDVVVEHGYVAAGLHLAAWAVIGAVGGALLLRARDIS